MKIVSTYVPSGFSTHATICSESVGVSSTSTTWHWPSALAVAVAITSASAVRPSITGIFAWYARAVKEDRCHIVRVASRRRTHAQRGVLGPRHRDDSRRRALEAAGVT